MVSAPKLLIVDDEVDLLAELKPMLERSGYTVATAANGEEALNHLDQATFDLIILDVLMPRMDGRTLLRRLRQQDNWTPVILLTQINTAMERVLSLQEGADDYLNKPFDPMELLARIGAILRRTAQRPNNTANTTAPLATPNELRAGQLLLDRQARQVLLNGNPLALTMRAFDLLAYLMLNTGEALTRERLLDEVWGWSYAVTTRAVDIRIAELRKALTDDPSKPIYIETVTGYGYRFMPRVQGEP